MAVHDAAAHGFERGAEAYERGRPGYSPEAVRWLATELDIGPGRTVVDVGAGTGKLTRALLPFGAAVIAVEPVRAMRATLERTAVGARTLDGTAEELGLDAASTHAIVVAQAFHWFDGPAALAEFHRVLRPHGRLGLVWNRRSMHEPLQRALADIVDPYRRGVPSVNSGDWRAALDASTLFDAVAALKVPFVQELDAAGVVARTGSTSVIAALDDEERNQVLSRIAALVADTPTPLRLRYTCEVHVYERADR